MSGLPVLHTKSLYPAEQLHKKLPTSSTHEPPFSHGLLAHSSISERHLTTYKYFPTGITTEERDLLTNVWEACLNKHNRNHLSWISSELIMIMWYTVGDYKFYGRKNVYGKWKENVKTNHIVSVMKERRSLSRSNLFCTSGVTWECVHAIVGFCPPPKTVVDKLNPGIYCKLNSVIAGS